MNELFFHECRAAGLVFENVSDWTDWLKEHKYDINKPVAEHDGFKYNINDVCINPHIMERKADTGSYFAVKTAKTQYGWIWGYDISLSSSGSGSPAGYPSRYDKSAIFYETEKQALHDALSFIIRQMENRKQQTKDTKVLAWIAKKERMNIIHRWNYSERRCSNEKDRNHIGRPPPPRIRWQHRLLARHPGTGGTV